MNETNPEDRSNGAIAPEIKELTLKVLPTHEQIIEEMVLSERTFTEIEKPLVPLIFLNEILEKDETYPITPSVCKVATHLAKDVRLSIDATTKHNRELKADDFIETTRLASYTKEDRFHDSMTITQKGRRHVTKLEKTKPQLVHNIGYILTRDIRADISEQESEITRLLLFVPGVVEPPETFTIEQDTSLRSMYHYLQELRGVFATGLNEADKIHRYSVGVLPEGLIQ